MCTVQSTVQLNVCQATPRQRDIFLTDHLTLNLKSKADTEITNSTFVGIRVVSLTTAGGYKFRLCGSSTEPVQTCAALMSDEIDGKYSCLQSWLSEG